jgi:MFS family permease
MATILGTSMATIGMIEGVAEATATITKVFSGTISDYLGKRKLLAVVGYGLSAIIKPIFPLAHTIGWVMVARFVDRIGKGIRGAPRDALVAELVPRELRGAAYGIRQSLDSVGAVVGPLIAVAFMFLFANDIRAVLWVAVLPAMIAVAVLVFGVQESEPTGDHPNVRSPVLLAELLRLPLRYWQVVMLGAVMTLARYSEAFLVLRTREVGLTLAYLPLVLIMMNVAYSVTAYPAGTAADQQRHRLLLITGLAMLIAGDIALAVAASPVMALLGATLWGVHMGLTQGLLAKLVADTAPAELRGTAFGIFNLISGGALFLASVVAGAIWSVFGAPAAFATSASFAALAILGLLLGHHTVRAPR